MSSRGAPTMPRCCFTVRRVRFLEVSCCWLKRRFVSGLGKGTRNGEEGSRGILRGELGGDGGKLWLRHH